MIVVTGGAGFIGSNLVAALLERGAGDVVVCDTLGTGDKWRNLAKHGIADLIRPDHLQRFLRRHTGRNAKPGGPFARVACIFHLGANSSTTENDVDLIVEQNVAPTLALWRLCSERNLRFVYASSAATYGDGRTGFDDDASEEALAALRPLNPYGWSKHVVDRRAVALAGRPGQHPPQWAGLKFFNVYGPNEYHKGAMQSVIAHKFPLARDGAPITLFKSGDPQYADGGQMRDFVYVRDCVDVMLWLYDNPRVSGLFNLGTGTARSFADLARALLAALDQPERISYIDMPEALRGRYQYFTEARMDRLRAAGYTRPFTSLEDGVADYVRHYLNSDDPYR